MRVTSLGHACFYLSSANASLITDPYAFEATGLKFPPKEADIVTISHNHADHNAKDMVKGQPIVVSGPGEYEIKGVRIIGISTFHDNDKGRKRGKNTIYHINMDEINLLHLGDLGHKLTEKEVDLFPEVDILFVPSGGFYTINGRQAKEVVFQLEPKIVIPMHYKIAGLKEDIGQHLETVDNFIKEMGQDKDRLTIDKTLTVSKNKLPDELQIVVLE